MGRNSSRLVIILFFVGVIVGAIIVKSATSGGGPKSLAEEAGCEKVTKPDPKSDQFAKADQVLKPGVPATAVLDTSCGEIKIALDTTDSPKTSNSFAFLADKGFYDDTVFHRIVKGFVVQGGDPKGTGAGGPGYSTDEPPPASEKYPLGTVAMAKSGAEPAGRSGSQFFIVVGSDTGLTPDYAVLGKVTEGLDVAQRMTKLGSAATDQAGTPRDVVVLKSVKIEQG